jgi:cytosine/adenosine deaminase-related metal-dependent hydrolase
MRSSAILAMATMNGAKALGMAGKVGEISPGACADLIAIPFSGAPAKAGDAIVNHSGPVQVSLIGGSRVYPWRSEL